MLWPMELLLIASANEIRSKQEPLHAGVAVAVCGFGFFRLG